MNIEEISRRRSILVSARFQFAPEAQEVRAQAIDQCVEHILFAFDGEGGVAPTHVSDVLRTRIGAGSQLIRDVEIRSSFQRLESAGRTYRAAGNDRYRLATHAAQDIEHAEKSATERFDRIVQALFLDSGPRFAEYKDAFFEFVCVIFSELGETYVRVLKGEQPRGAVTATPIFKSATRLIRGKYKALDATLFERAASRFFETLHPDFDALKWNLAQNYYVAKCLGLDSSGQLLSKELFGGAVLYLDTNVVLNAVEPEAQHHNSFEALSRLCAAMGADLRVAQISVNEARSTSAGRRANFRKLVDQIPEALSDRVHDVFFDAYRRRKALGGVDIDALFEQFENPLPALEKFGVERIDDQWFNDSDRDATVLDLTKAIKERASHRKYPKRDRAALHDAQMMVWVARERENSGSAAWLVTLDRSLSGISVGRHKSIAIPLDALLQWLSPVAAQIHDSADVAYIFSESLKYQVLPAENFFDMQDFTIFSEMEWDCKALPPRDVEDCIAHIRRNAGNLDPRTPVDRERLARVMKKFFADPSREMQRDREEYEAEILRFESERKLAEQSHRGELAELKGQMEAISVEVAVIRSELENARRGLKMEAASLADEREKLRRARIATAMLRTVLGGFIFAVSTVLVSIPVVLYAPGDDWWNKMAAFAEIVTPLLGIAATLAFQTAGAANLKLLFDVATGQFWRRADSRPVVLERPESRSEDARVVQLSESLDVPSESAASEKALRRDSIAVRE